MNVQHKLDVFKQKAMQEAMEKNTAMQNEVENEYAEAIAQITKNAQRISDEKYRKACFDAEQMKNKEIIQASSDMKKEFVKLRNERLDAIFSAVDKKLSDFRLSPEYRTYLVDEIKKYVSKFGSGETYLDSSDMIYAEEIQGQTGMVVLQSSEELLGGFKLTFNNGHTLVDHSFKSRRTEVKKDINLFSISY